MNTVEDCKTHVGASCWPSTLVTTTQVWIICKGIIGRLDPYLLVHYGAHQVLDSGQRQVTGLQVHRLSSQSYLQQEGHPMEGATGVGGAGDAVAAVGQPRVERSGRARRGWVVRMERVEEGSR